MEAELPARAAGGTVSLPPIARDSQPAGAISGSIQILEAALRATSRTKRAA
jgi:hypothetical protein